MPALFTKISILPKSLATSSAVAPGFIITDMTAQLPEDVRKEWAAKITKKVKETGLKNEGKK